MFQIISASEVAGLEDGDGQDGSLGVLYQLRTTGGLYRFNPSSGETEGITTLNNSGQLTDASGSVFAVSEVTPYVTRTSTGTAYTGACELAGYDCTAVTGSPTITIYDGTSTSGTVIVPATTLTVGRTEFTWKRALTTGCHVVLSGTQTVNVLVG